MKPGQWWDVSWNPVTGCTPVSEACEHCWAREMVGRFPNLHCDCSDEPSDRNDFSIIHTHPSRLDAPLKWRKPRRVFVVSLGDLFHEQINIRGHFIRDIFRIMISCPDHTFYLLTKRPHRMAQAIENLYGSDLADHGPHIWLGVTAENQARADERIPILLQIPAAKHFVSIEPMLGMINLNFIRRFSVTPGSPLFGREYYDALRGYGAMVPQTEFGRKLDWVIVGGESGPKARPMHPDWVRSIRDQCQAAGVPFWFKQWGDMVRVGTKRAGRILDGRTWEERP